MTTVSPSPSQLKIWFAAIKPPMYTVAIIPIWVGTAVAVSEQRTLHLGIFATFLMAAILIIAWLNLSNDVFDSETGIDKNKVHSLVNLTGNKPLIFSLANLCLLLGLSGIVAIALWQQDITLVALILGCCALGYSYQGPPFRLGYQGLGEPICFLTFGPMALAAAYYSQTQSWQGLLNHPLPFLITSSFIGLSTSIILFCSHFHQVDDDLAAGKRSPIVRLGTQRGATVLNYVTGLMFLGLAIGISLGQLPVWVLLTFLSLPIAIQLCRHVQRHHNQPQQVSNCKFIAVNLHFLSGLFLGLGLTL